MILLPSGIVTSGQQVASWASVGGPVATGYVVSPWRDYYEGSSAARFDRDLGTAMVCGTLADWLPTTTPRTALVRVGDVQLAGPDVRDAEPLWQDTSTTYYTCGFVRQAGGVFVVGGVYAGGAWHQTDVDPARVSVIPGHWHRITESFDGTTYTLQVDDRPSISVLVGGSPPGLTGGVRLGINYHGQHSSFTLAQVGGTMPGERVVVQPTPWGNGEGAMFGGRPSASSGAILVVDTTASDVVLDVTIYASAGITAANAPEFSVVVETDTGYGPTHRTVVAPPAITGDWMDYSTPAVPLPGANRIRRVRVVMPAHGSGIRLTVQSLRFTPDAYVACIPEPHSAPLLALETMGGGSLGNGNTTGFWVVGGLLNPSYEMVRDAHIWRMMAATEGHAPGTLLAYSPQTNDLRNGVAPSDAQEQARVYCAALKSARPDWRLVYVTTQTISLASAGAFRAAEAAGASAGGADVVVDGSTLLPVAGLCDGTHPWQRYSAGIAAALASHCVPGRMVWMSGCSLACGSAMLDDGSWCVPMAEGIPAFMRSIGW